MSDMLQWTSAPASSIPNMNWKSAQGFPVPYLSAAQPALTVFLDRLWCMHRRDTDMTLWYASYFASNWMNSELQVSNGQQSPGGPALAAYIDQLWCAYYGTDNLLYVTTRNSSTGQWSTPKTLGSSRWTPALTVFKDQLWCVYSDKQTSTLHYTFTPDGIGWANGTINGTLTNGLGLTVFKDQLWCVYREADDRYNRLYVVTSRNGETWSTPVPIPGQTSDCAPALAYIAEIDALLCVYGDGKGGSVFYYTINTTGDPSTWSPPKAINQNPRAPGTGVGLAEYQGNIFCVYRSA